MRERRDPTDDELRASIPRRQGGRELRIGIFVLIGVASLMAALFLLTDPATLRGRYLITTLVEDAGGVRKKDPVQLRGINIGRVHSFSIADHGVVVTLEIEGQWELPSDSRTRLVSSGLLGGRTVEIVEGESPRPIQPGEQLAGEKVEGLLDFPPELGQDAQNVLRQIQGLLADPTIGAVEASAMELRELLATLSQLADAQGRELATLTASLNRSAEGLENAAGSGEDLARAVARADTALVTVNRTSEALLDAISSLEGILGRIDRGEGTLGQLSTNADLYQSILDTSESIRLLAIDLRENPGRYVKVEIF